jgi:serine/threonine-protein kinase HipA
MVFSIMIANTDDHLRNHGFLYVGSEGWSLSPAYDINPTPIEKKPRILSTNITMDDGTGSLDLALEVAEYFELSLDEGREIIAQVRAAIGGWQKVASHMGLTKNEIDYMSSAFSE